MRDCRLELQLSCLGITLFLCGSVSASGLYMNALHNRYSDNYYYPLNDYDNVYTYKLKSVLALDDQSVEIEEALIMDNSSEVETNPIKVNGARLPLIEENPHLEEIDETFSKCNGIEIRELTIMQIQELFATNKLTSLELTRCYIERIEKTNEVLRSVNEVNPDALNQAAKADIERKLGKPGRGLMHGIPTLLKENIATNDRMETTAGSLALVGIRPRSDAEIVKALRKTGAVIIGKANLSEFAFFRGTNLPSGWSGRGGQTRNAYNMNVTPEGSSSGSAVAVAANLATVSVGTETDGSLIAPASVGGVCTLKPTHGTLPIKGIIPISHTQDHAGPMARSVTDLAILLDAMISEGGRNEKHPPSFTECLLKNKNPRPFRIGVMRHPFFNTSAINSTNLQAELVQLDEMIDVMKNSLQFEVLDPLSPEISLLKNISGERELLVLTYDFKHDINEYLSTEVIGPYPIPSRNPTLRKDKTSATLSPSYPLVPPSELPPTSTSSPRKIASLTDIIKFNEEHPTPEGYNQELLIMSEATDGINNETYIEARDANRGAARKVLDSLLLEHDLDAVLTPSESRYEGVLEEELKDSSVVGYSLAAISGYPSINIPAGIGMKDVPFGITFTGVPHSEATLLQIAYAVEQLNPKRTRPKFLI